MGSICAFLSLLGAAPFLQWLKEHA